MFKNVLTKITFPFLVIALTGCGPSVSEILEKQNLKQETYNKMLRVNLSEIKKEFENQGLPPFLLTSNKTEINSAGGVSIKLSFMNLSEKTIKYIDFAVKPFNAVGDEISAVAILKATGPISWGERYATEKKWGNVWYNTTFNCFEVISIKITYMDNSLLEINKEKIDKIYMNLRREKVKNDCKCNVSY